MKKSTIITAFAAIFMMAITPAFAQEENGFQWFHDAELLCAGDKAQALGLHTAYTANGTPFYTEATMVIECKIMYAAPFDPQYFKSDAPKKIYANFPAGIHSMYIGEVINAWKK